MFFPMSCVEIVVYMLAYAKYLSIGVNSNIVMGGSACNCRRGLLGVLQYTSCLVYSRFVNSCKS